VIGQLLGNSRHGIVWLPMLMLGGGALTMLGYLGAVVRAGGGLRPSLAGRHPLFRHVLRASSSFWLRNPSTLLGLVAYRAAGSFLPRSAFSALNYAERISNSLSVVLTNPLERVGLPSLSEAAAASDMPRMRETLASQARLFSVVALAVVLFAVMQARNIVQVLYGYGQFAADGGLVPTATALQIMVPAIWVGGLFNLLVNAEYALKRHRPLLIRFIAVDLARVIFFIALTWLFKLEGLVAAKVLLTVWGLWLLVVDLRPHLGPLAAVLFDGHSARYAAGLLVIAALDAALSLAARRLGLSQPIPLLVLAGLLWGGGSLFLAGRLRIPEGEWIRERVLARFRAGSG
jgi:peptidoglycan biosynthesis protein MviN/MurJ (putative lipid II flippase)